MESSLSLKELSLSEIKDIIALKSPVLETEFIEQLARDPRKGVQNLLRQYKKQREKEKAEAERLYALWKRERDLAEQGYHYVAGLDEVGRGPLAGPVVAACVILPLDCKLSGLNDSKKVLPAERDLLAEEIKGQAIAWAIGLVDHQEIDRLNILQATKVAMLQAISKMSRQPDYLLIDALELDISLPQEGIVHGDSCSASIAAASILAKTYRDSLMVAMDQLYPEYGFAEHKGYGTARHYDSIRQFGPCPIHRKSFLHNI